MVSVVKVVRPTQLATKKTLSLLVASFAMLNVSIGYAGEGLENAEVTGVQFQFNDTNWAARNLLDFNNRSRWLSRQQTNDINILLDSTGDPACFAGLSLQNFNVSNRNIKEFALLTTSNDALAADFGVAGWQPIPQNDNPTDLLNYMSWAQGARLVDFTYQHNANRWAAEHINDGDTFSQWLSNRGRNELEFSFDADWNGTNGDPINIDELEFLNYGNDDRSVRDFQVAYTTDGNVWRLLEVPGSEENDPDFIFTRESEGGKLDRVDNALSVTRWSGDHANDGDPNTQWLSAKGNNYLEFSFDPDFDLTSGKDGDTDDLFDISKIRIRNYGNNDDRSVRHFQVAYKTLTNSNWRKIEVPGSVPNEPDFNYALLFHGALMTEKSSELNSTSSGADNIHDGDQNTRWLARDLASRLAFQFDPEENNAHAEDSDLFTFEAFSLLNYGVDDRSINEFQVEVKTRGNTDWTPIRVPGAQIGDPDFNFALVNNGGILRSVDSEANNTNWAGRNINDGSHKTSWLSRKNNNVLEFVFDLDRDNATGGDGDLFSFDKFYIQNYGVDDRSIYEFQIEVQVKGSENWTAIPVPGAATGDPNFNFLLSNNGAELTLIDSEINTTQWGADNFHDGAHTTRWLSNKMFNNLEFRFDVNHDDDFADTEDQFTIERFYLQNYGADDRSIKDFQVHVIMGDNPDWQRIQVPGSEAGQAGYNFTLEGHGGAVTFVDSELNSTSWAASNINDGDKGTRWLSNKQQNTIEFEFDTDYANGTGDLINIDKIKLINYGNSDRSVATFQVEYLTSDTPGVWQVLSQTDGATIFNAARNGNEQEWDVPDVANVSSVRFVSLTNHGDSRYTGVSEFIVEGDTVGPIYSFRAAMNGNGEYFELDPANYPTNVKALRFQSLTNYGDFSYAGLREFKVLGPSTLESTIFTANMDRDGQVFTLDNNDIPKNVTGVRLVTISNHGDPNYIAAREFKVLGEAVNETTIFTAQMIAEKQRFELDGDDIVNNVTDVRLVTISNHGDRSYIGAREFEIFGPSITAAHTFVGTMSAAEQTWVMDPDDIPIDVTEVQLITINNYGDRSYIGLREFEVLGNGVTPSRTFTLPMTKGPHRITLDNADQISGAVGVKLITINNHGDPSYTGLTEFKLFGSPEIPNSATNATYKDYIFEAENVGQLQAFEFSEVNSKYLRLHTMTNFNDRSYTEAAEIGVVEGNCAAGQWHLDELSWSGTDGEVLDNSKFGLHGKAFGFGNGEGANTAGNNSAIPGSPGTCRYGTFDGVDDYIEIPDSDGLDNTSALTISAWFNADTLQQTNGTNARGLLSKRPSFSNNVSYGMFFLRNAGGKLYIDIDRTNDRFTTNTVFTTERWYHIAVVFDGSLPANERVAVYVDGQLDGRFRESSSFIPNTDSNFYIGNLYTGTSELKVFDGAIDEVSVLPFAYSQVQINKLMNQTRPCDAQVDHIRITHSGSGVSCADHSVNLTACANADCTAIYTGSDINFTLQKNSNGVISDLGTYVIDGTTGQRNNA
ncbi:MAG: hypothetical protein KTR16_05770, partial [Acidiferrobacterales bacterium]|nr:hypothetical protein [Acidiferrobacterales bacterium]